MSTKQRTLEAAADLQGRIEAASHYFPREQLALSTQCGFASVLQGNPVDAAVQEAKLRLVTEVARRVW